MIKTSAIFLFLKYCLGKKVDISKVVANLDWRHLYTFASNQAILGFCFNSSGYSFPSRSIPSKQKPRRDCLEAKVYSCCQFISTTTLFITTLFPRQYFKNKKIADVLVISYFRYFLSLSSNQSASASSKLHLN